MSVASVRAEIGKFLARPDAEVLCLRGKWGVGKTYIWKNELEIAHKAHAVKMPRYSYVSLFGLNSIDELKLAIFENVITLKEGLRKADLTTLEAFLSNQVKWRKWTKYAKDLPVIGKYFPSDIAAALSFKSVNNQIICIDDIERRGQKLEVCDVLGLISSLKEQSGCKVALILNDEQLPEKDKEAFEKNLEKIADTSLLYGPRSEDSVRIAIPEVDDLSQQIAARCITLGITNIRVIKRAVRLVHEVNALLTEYDEEVFKAVMPSVILFSWSHDQPDEAPPFSFLRKKSASQFGFRRTPDESPQEVEWNALLEAYEYMSTDDLDLLLMKSVSDGHFDHNFLKDAFVAADQKAVAAKVGGSFEAAWGPYHDSFADNKTEVLDGIYASFMRSFPYITPINLNGTVKLFKDLERDDHAQEMLAHYIANRDEAPQFFNLSYGAFSGDVDDPDVRAAFAKKLEEAQKAEIIDIAKLLLAKRGTWGEEQLAELAAASVQEYVSAFKSHTGHDLREMLSNVFQYDRVINATPTMRRIAELARAALALIGAESDINARRVSRYGVEIKPPFNAREPVNSER